jgi:hypothetical protein
VAAVLLLAGGDDKTARQSPAPHAVKRPAKPSNPSPPKQTPSSSTPAPTPAAPSGKPTAALTDFYTRAANHDFGGAWALGTDRLHAQFGNSIDTFRGTLSTLQSITFPSMSVTSQTGSSATVAFTSVAQHTDRTDRCSGQAALIAQGSQWLVDHIDVNCAADPGAAGGGPKAKPDKHGKPKGPKGPKGPNNSK